MIELNEEQKKALARGEAVRLREDGQEYVLLRADLYDKIAEEDSPWVDAEMDELAKEAEKLLDEDRP